MSSFQNTLFNISDIKKSALFICAVGYEERSYYLLKQFRRFLPPENIMVFAFQDFTSHTDKPSRIKEENLDGITVIESKYGEKEKFLDKLHDFLKSRKDEMDQFDLHVDYSYMPRSWYCGLPLHLDSELDENDTVSFWYSEGIYPKDYKQYPTGGIKSFVPFSGAATLRSDLRRTHIIGLSYDKIRTNGILSILDPEQFVACNAFDSSTREIHNNVIDINKNIISRAAMSISLHMEDFEFMLSKLCELAHEYIPYGDVVFIPDGPKPLIFAFSLVPELLGKKGVVCLHVHRNDDEEEPVDVSANGKVIGFSIKRTICKSKF